MLDRILGRNDWTCPEEVAQVPILENGSGKAVGSLAKWVGRKVFGIGSKAAPRTRLTPGGGLAAHERVTRGHTLARHLGPGGRACSKRALRGRLQREPNIPAAPTFGSRAVAEDAVSGTILTNSQKIASWLASPTKAQLIVRQTFDSPVGSVVRRGARFARREKEATVILRKEKSQLGYYVKTAFPGQ